VRLLDEVELLPEMHLELVGEGLDLEELRGARAPLEEARRRAQHREVELDLLDDARAPHLHDDLAAALQERTVRLRDRRRRERLRVDPREDLVAEVGEDDRLHVGERHRRHLVDEPRELVDVRIR